MRNLLDQLYKTKLQLLATIMTVVGVVLLVASRWIVGGSPASWLKSVPFDELGSALFTTGLLAVAFEYINRNDGEARAKQQLREVLRDEAPAIRDAVYDSFAFNAAALNRIASPEILDGLARNALTAQLGDRVLAEEVYADLRDQVVQAPERWHGLRIDVDLAVWEGPARDPRNPMFVATVRHEYRVRPAQKTLRFVCTGDLAEYRELQRDPAIADRWYFEPVRGLGAAEKTAFELVQLAVDGVERPIRRTARLGSQTYSAHLGTAVADSVEVTVSYTYRVLIQQRSHMVSFAVPRPTRGLAVRLTHSDTIHYINIMDFIANAKQPRVERSPVDVPERSVSVAFDQWVFPLSGIAFVWVLRSEMPHLEVQAGNREG